MYGAQADSPTSMVHCGQELFLGGEESMACEAKSYLSVSEIQKRRSQRLNYLSRSASSPKSDPSPKSNHFSKSQSSHQSPKSCLYPRSQSSPPCHKNRKSALFPRDQRFRPSLRNFCLFLLLFYFPVSNSQRIFTAGAHQSFTININQ